MKIRLISNCRRKWWRLWSIRWAAGKSALIAAALANPLAILDFMRELPRPLRVAVPLALLAIFWGLDALTRLVHQQKVARHDASAQ